MSTWAVTVTSRAAAWMDQGSAEEAVRDPLADLPDFGSQLLVMLVYLGLTLILILVLAKLLPRWLGRAPVRGSRGRLEVLEVRRLGPRHCLYLVRLDDRELLLGAGEGGMVDLGRGAERGAGRDFADLLGNTDGDGPTTREV